MSRLTVLDVVAWEGREIPGDRTAALLRALAAAGPGGLGEDELVGEVWPTDPPANPRKALQVVVSRARSVTSAEVIERTRRGYRLGLPAIEVDAWALRPEGLRLAAAGRWSDALPLLERAAVGGDAEVVAALLRALGSVRGVPAALERYEEYRAGLAASLGVDPSPELRALHAELLAADRPVRSGVRYDADRLIGREADLAALRVLVRTHRVVSIIGTGGLGKTRLVHLIARSAEQPVVHVVELAGVTSPEGVAVEVADALGVRESVAGRPVVLRPADLLTRLVDAVGTVPVLLVLDNCEHLVDAVADLVAALVSRTPRLTVLTTSRVPLGLPAERAYPLPELPPDEAAVLFADRATAARPGVVLDPDDVRELVMRLDGLPLALELAAAKVRSMSVVEITRRLDNRFALLRGGSRAAPERHQTLLAVIDWSWNLLTQEQRVALRRLAVFRDGFSLDGAAAVLGGDAREVVAALVEHSLVVVREAAGVRYRLLETVREFGRMQLVDAGEDALADKALSAWATELATVAGRRLNSPDQVATMALVREEEGNLVDVLRRGLAADDRPAVTALYAVLAGFWIVEGSHAKVTSIGPAVVRLLLSTPTAPELADGVRVCLTVAGINEMIFQNGVSGPLLDRLRLLGPGSDPQVATMVRVLLESGVEASVQQIQRLVELAADPDPVVARLALGWLSRCYENLGDLAAALTAARRALELCDDAYGPWMRGVMSASVAGLAFQTGDLVDARFYAQAALPVLASLGAHEDYVQTLATLAMLALHEGRLDEAAQIFDEVAAEDGAQALFGGATELMCGRAELLLARGETDAGLAAYTAALAAIRDRSAPGPQLPPALEYWTMVAQGALVAAFVRAGRPARQDRDELLVRAREATSGPHLADVPVLGCALFALAVWEIVFGDRGAGAALLAYADRFAFNRMLPSLDWSWAVSLAQPAGIAPGDPAELREPLNALLRSLA
ncbi:putative ATPase [Allocatelliglobosispora scoriae]|uniref:Putative ATPase n=1 Tax=Allocatelliglobosispora scoriae TaxID=643052 RepID=A0A841C325_9ACTN|nr:BTAD domain-containing putative transcriptional regulator [Allocatelliglobosispora scoriae]MBB5873709.1 putative ATPase [Allocatelliglobosispora scoriae]